ncbi:AI-2E family transporter [Halobacterium sp. R2-5]|uniref:AI-2E family transporter n=1 Tax=Halobacterium sp. R2-5 TaxID=2715751 RepID=UPI00141EC1DD|nr:AI-2E family transporter [Halobacterium sp. R2-5]NIB98299.1 AI-2E family transporter [Halobacterium sp. R2-5]
MNLPREGVWRTVGWVVVILALLYFLVTVVEPVFGSLVFAVWVYYAMRQIYARLEDRTEHPDLAVTATILLILVPVFLIVGYAAWTAIKELTDVLTHTQLQQYQPILRPYVDLSQMGPGRVVEQLRQNPREAFDQQLRTLLSGALGRATTAAGLLFFIGVRVFLMLVFLFYLLRDDYKLAGWFRDSVGGDARIVTVLESIDDHLETLFVGNFISIVALGTIALVVYNGMDFISPPGISVPYPFLFGLLTGVGTIVPGIGIKVIYYPLAAYLFAVSFVAGGPLWFPIVFLVLTQVLVDIIPDIFLRSYFSAGDLNMGLVMLAYVIGSIAFGWWGVFFGPILLITIVVVGREVFPDVAKEFRSRR